MIDDDHMADAEEAALHLANSVIVLCMGYNAEGLKIWVPRFPAQLFDMEA